MNADKTTSDNDNTQKRGTNTRHERQKTLRGVAVGNCSEVASLANCQEEIMESQKEAAIMDTQTIESVKEQLRSCRSKHSRLQLKLSQLSESSDEWSETSSQIDKMKGEISRLESELSGNETLIGSATELETVPEDVAPTPLSEIAAVFNDSEELSAKVKAKQIHQVVTNHLQPRPDPDRDAVSVGETTITTMPPSTIEVNEQDDTFDETRISTISAVLDPSLDSLSATPILRATLVTEPESTRSMGTVYSAVEISDEPLPFWKRHRRTPLVIIICILVAAIIGIVFGIQRNDTELDSASLWMAESTSPSFSRSPSTYVPSMQPSISSQPTICDTYRVIPHANIYNEDCREFCDPLVDMDGNHTIIARPHDEKIQFYTLNNGTFERSAVFNSNSYLWSVAISGDYGAAGIPEYNNYTGAVIVFERNSSNIWNNVMQIEPQDVTGEAYFGFSVQLDRETRETLVIGAPDDASKGSVYIYRRVNNTWIQEAKLFRDTEAGVFGEAVSIQGNLLAVGDVQDGANDEGIVLIYEYDSASHEWNPLSNVTNDQCLKNFGVTLTLTADNGLFVMCGDDMNNTETGAIYYYLASDDGQYELQQTIMPPEGSFKSAYKVTYEIVVDGSNMILSSYDDVYGKTHVYTMENDSWIEVNRISAPPGDYEFFADSVALSGSLLAVSSGVNVHTYSLEDC